MRRAGRQIDDRLIDDEELVVLQRALDVADDTGIDAATQENRLVARVALRRVHLSVGDREQRLRGRAVVRIDRPADASVDLDRGAVDAERPAQRVAKTPDERCRALVSAGPDGEHDELVSADAGDRVRFANDGLEPARERLQDRVAGAVASHVVHVLEAVEVDRDQRERLARSA